MNEEETENTAVEVLFSEPKKTTSEGDNNSKGKKRINKTTPDGKDQEDEPGEEVDLAASQAVDKLVLSNNSTTLDLQLEALTKSSIEELFLMRNVKGSNLTWQNVNLNVVKSNKGAIEKEILKGIGGEALKNETTAIMGASGSGKTSLFNAISGRISNSKTGPLALNGDIRFGPYQMNDSNRSNIQDQIAYVAQFDTLHEASTPREAITFSARLRLPKETKRQDIDNLVNNTLHALMLDKCADTMIGGELIKGISGGQKKRTSIAIEMVTSPSVIM